MDRSAIYFYWTSFLSAFLFFFFAEVRPEARMCRSRTRSSLATPVFWVSVSRWFSKQRRVANFWDFFPKKEKKTRKTKTYRRRRRCSCLGDAAVCCDCGEGKRRREEPGSVVVPTSMCRVCARCLCLRMFYRSLGNAMKYEKFAGIACLCVCVSCLIGNLCVSHSFPSIICLFWRCVTCCWRIARLVTQLRRWRRKSLFRSLSDSSWWNAQISSHWTIRIQLHLWLPLQKAGDLGLIFQLFLLDDALCYFFVFFWAF